MMCSICGAEQTHIGPCPYCVKRYGQVLAWATVDQARYNDQARYWLKLRPLPSEGYWFTHCDIDYGSEKNWVTLFNIDNMGKSFTVQGISGRHLSGFQEGRPGTSPSHRSWWHLNDSKSRMNHHRRCKNISRRIERWYSNPNP